MIRCCPYANSIDYIKIFAQAIQAVNETLFLIILLDHVRLSPTYVMSIYELCPIP